MSVKIFLCGLIYACQESFAGHDIVRCQVTQYGGTHSAALRSALLPFPASSLPRELVSGRHPPTSRGRGLATSAVLRDLTDDMSMKKTV